MPPICFWAHKMAVMKLEKRAWIGSCGMKPGESSGNYQEHLNFKFGWANNDGEAYGLTVVGKAKGNSTCMPIKVPIVPLHEAVSDELNTDPTILPLLDEALSDGRLPPSYHENVVVQSVADPPVPVAIYMDGLPYSLVDSVLGIWAIMLLTGTRRLVGVIRKKLVCECGCRGWCTWYPVLRCLHWSCETLAAATFPEMRHDGAGSPPARSCWWCG